MDISTTQDHREGMNALRTHLIDGHWLRLWHVVLLLALLSFLGGTVNGWSLFAGQAAETQAITQPKSLGKSEKQRGGIE